MDIQKLSPSAKLTLDALKAGPGNVHELSDRTGRSRSTTDKAINDLHKAGLIAKVSDDGDPADGAPTRWQLSETPTDTDTDQSEQPEDGGNITEPDLGVPTDESTTPGAEAGPGTEVLSPGDGDRPDDQVPPAGGALADGTAQPQSETGSETDGEATHDGEGKPDREDQPEEDEKKAEAEPPKLCRGCQAQMPKICECCWQKTPSYCGTCRKDMPQIRRGEPGEPVILANGLPKLRPGELEAMVEKVMREQPMPAFQGIVGWTGGRLAIHIPGRSPGAMTNAMRKFAKEGKAELVGDAPERYQLKVTEQPQPDDETNDSQESTTGAGDALVEDTGADSEPQAGAEAPLTDTTA